MTAQNIIEQIEKIFGRQPEKIMFQLINDALDDIASNKRNYTVSATTDLEKKKRWYELSDDVIDIIKVEVLDTNSRYVRIPKLADPHELLRADTDETEDSLT
tara:strand:- start:6 stop:311 length:306 start_codon:yes stop_codon:yes gene_type:complete